MRNIYQETEKIRNVDYPLIYSDVLRPATVEQQRFTFNYRIHVYSNITSYTDARHVCK